jgi:hypothetical protein
MYKKDEIPTTKENNVDLREELRHLEHLFRWFGLRHIDFSRPCTCKLATDTVDPECKRCLRIGYLFTDYLVKGYMWLSALGFEFRTSTGDISTQRKNLVIKHNRPVNKFDKVLILDINPENGQVLQPFKISREFSIQDVMAVLGKDGRVEFWRCSLEERNLDDGRYAPHGVDSQYKGNRSNGEPW